jgi:acetoin utilization protein AcuB
MHSNPQTAGPGDSLTEAAARMAEYRIGCLPITEGGVLVSMVTTTDILSAEARQSLGGAPSGTTAADIMTRDPATAHPDDTLLIAAARMQRLNVRHLPIVDATHRVIGMLSDRDLRTVIGNAFFNLDRQSPAGELAERRVGHVMTRDVLTVSPGQSVAELAAELMGRAIGALPVVDDDGRLVGIVSIVDVLRGLAPPTG